eukprot:Hpha_TRINITY_DN15770_c6_g1::TRINITY_DN15770_c6_g1_i1::g.41358::m.41358
MTSPVLLSTEGKRIIAVAGVEVGASGPGSGDNAMWALLCMGGACIGGGGDPGTEPDLASERRRRVSAALSSTLIGTLGSGPAADEPRLRPSDALDPARAGGALPSEAARPREDAMDLPLGARPGALKRRANTTSDSCCTSGALSSSCGVGGEHPVSTFSIFALSTVDTRPRPTTDFRGDADSRRDSGAGGLPARPATVCARPFLAPFRAAGGLVGGPKGTG